MHKLIFKNFNIKVKNIKVAPNPNSFVAHRDYRTRFKLNVQGLKVGLAVKEHGARTCLGRNLVASLV